MLLLCKSPCHACSDHSRSHGSLRRGRGDALAPAQPRTKPPAHASRGDPNSQASAWGQGPGWRAGGTQRGPPGPHPSSDHRISRTVNWHGPRHCSEWPVTLVSNYSAVRLSGPGHVAGSGNTGSSSRPSAPSARQGTPSGILSGACCSGSVQGLRAGRPRRHLSPLAWPEHAQELQEEDVLLRGPLRPRSRSRPRAGCSCGVGLGKGLVHRDTSARVATRARSLSTDRCAEAAVPRVSAPTCKQQPPSVTTSNVARLCQVSPGAGSPRTTDLEAVTPL